jgi:hypothetical protein
VTQSAAPGVSTQHAAGLRSYSAGVGFRDRVLQALDDGRHDEVDPNEVVALSIGHLDKHGIEASIGAPAPTRGRPKTIGLNKYHAVELRVRRADYERSAYFLDRYIRTTYDVASFDIAPTIATVATASTRLLAELHAVDAATFRQPSQLPGWTVALRNGDKAVMYPGGLAARAAAIDHEAANDVGELLDHLEQAMTDFAATWSEPLPTGFCRSVPDSTPFATDTVLLRRLREIEVHGSDTGIASLAPAFWSNAYVGADLTPQWDTVNRRTSASVHLVDEMGGVWRGGDNSAAAHETTRRNILAWLLDRHHEPGLPELTTWGDQSRWGS